GLITTLNFILNLCPCFSVDLLRARTTSATLVAWDLPARSLFPLDISGSLRYTSFASSFLIGRSVCFIASYQRRGFLSSFLSLLQGYLQVRSEPSQMRTWSSG